MKSRKNKKKGWLAAVAGRSEEPNMLEKVQTRVKRVRRRYRRVRTVLKAADQILRKI